MTELLDQYLLRAYLNGELDPPAAEEFELLMLDRPELAEAVAADTALGIGLRDAGAAAVRPASLPAPQRISRLRGPLGWALAAGIALALGLGAGARLGRPDGAGMAAAPIVYVDATRGATDLPEFTLPTTGPVVLALPAPAAGCTPKVVLRQGTAERTANASPSNAGFASLVLDAASLQTGPAFVAISCAGQEVANYHVQFRH